MDGSVREGQRKRPFDIIIAAFILLFLLFLKETQIEVGLTFLMVKE